MHPVIIEAVAAERSRDLRAQAVAGRRARLIRRIPRAERTRARRLVIRVPLRTPRAA